MSVLICGGAGYIGSHVNKELSKAGCDTIVFDNLVRGHAESVRWGTFVEGDLACVSDIEMVFNEYNIDVVIHLAGFAYVGESVEKPEVYYYNNVVNTLNLLHVMKEHDCKKIIFSSTCAVYGEPGTIPITEDLEQHPISPYGASKSMIERILKDYHDAYGLQYVILRYFNAAGADPEGEIGESHENETHLIPLLLDVAGGKRKYFDVYGNDYYTPDGSCIRDYIHVTDLAQAHWLALHYLEDGNESNTFNLGTALGVSVFEVIESVKKVTKKEISVTVGNRRFGDPAILVSDPQKAKRILEWKPVYSDIDVIIEHAWKWHENREY